jgi:alkanesulfonate monooxygenase SsuD/methylene tetrahydromethanopterin reductase-like flavin-dependent oxidoreductase (luciferase family)
MLRIGKQYLEAIRDGRAVFLGGEQVEDVTEHPAFRNAARAMARLYDVTSDPGSADRLTYAVVPPAGTPETVYAQIKEFYDHVGGLGHLLMMGQGGHLNHEDTVDNLTMFSKEVLPRLQAL